MAHDFETGKDAIGVPWHYPCAVGPSPLRECIIGAFASRTERALFVDVFACESKEVVGGDALSGAAQSTLSYRLSIDGSNEGFEVFALPTVRLADEAPVKAFITRDDVHRKEGKTPFERGVASHELGEALFQYQNLERAHAYNSSHHLKFESNTQEWLCGWCDVKGEQA